MEGHLPQEGLTGTNAKENNFETFKSVAATGNGQSA